MGGSRTTEGRAPFVSYAHNHEDVILDRALREVAAGRYIDVGPRSPRTESVTNALYERGWAGILVETSPDRADELRTGRPRDAVVSLASTADATSAEDAGVPAGRLDEVLEDAGWADLDLHVMTVDAGAAQSGILGSLDLGRWRPWILLIQAAHPAERDEETWDAMVRGQGYELCLFDGVSRFYVAAEKAAELHGSLSTPVNVRDHYIPHALRVVEEERDEAIAALRSRDEDQQDAIVRWRDAALRSWSTSAQVAADVDLRRQVEQHANHVRHIDAELAAMRRTLSWRITRPLRRVRSVSRRTGTDQ